MKTNKFNVGDLAKYRGQIVQVVQINDLYLICGYERHALWVSARELSDV